MKRTNKYLSLALAIIMALSLCVTSFAADGKITITNAEPGETYQLYQLFDATYVNAEQAAYTYTKTGESDALYAELAKETSPFALEATTTTDVYNVTLKDGSNIDDIIKFVNDNIAIIPKVQEVKTAPAAAEGEEKSKVEWKGLDFGYYFIDSSLGSLVTINTTTPTVNVTEKNAEPTLEKKIVLATGDVDTTNASIGDEIDYKITVSNAVGTDKAITVHDTMEAGLTLDATSFVVKVGENAATKDTDYTVNATAETFELVLTETFVKALADTDKVIITYTANLDKDATLDANTNDNTAWLTYSNQTGAKDTVTVSTYSFDLVKTDADGNILATAEFKLYDAAEEGNLINVVKVGNNYRVADATETNDDTIVSIASEKVVISGLGNGTYYLEETKAPAGYNKLPTRFAVTINNGSLVATSESEKVTVGEGEDATTKTVTTWTNCANVINQSGSVLPSTGGVGTTMFYVLGSVMMIGAAILLVTKKKMANEQ